jgi:hypothetical protein
VQTFAWIVIGLLIVICLLLSKIDERLGEAQSLLDQLNDDLDSGITDLGERLDKH